MLTKKQKELYDYLVLRIGEDGYSPSFEEMKKHLGLKSKSGIHRLISALEERGYIRRLPYRHRAIEIVSQRGTDESSVKARLVIRAAEKLRPRYHDHRLTVSEKSFRDLQKAIREYRA